MPLTYADLGNAIELLPQETKTGFAIIRDNAHYSYLISEFKTLPDSCSDLLDKDHLALHFDGTNIGKTQIDYPLITWEQILQTIKELTPEQRMQQVTVFDASLEEAWQANELYQLQDGSPILCFTL